MLIPPLAKTFAIFFILMTASQTNEQARLQEELVEKRASKQKLTGLLLEILLAHLARRIYPLVLFANRCAILSSYR